MYEAMSYYVQIFYLILVLIGTEFISDDLYEQQQKFYLNPDLKSNLMNNIRAAQLDNIIIINDKDDVMMNKLERKFKKEISIAQHQLDECDLDNPNNTINIDLISEADK